MTSNRPSRGGGATLDDVVGALQEIGYTLADLLEVTRAAAASAEVPLYCPPTEHCRGGVRLMRHPEAYWKHDGKDQDRLYHPLPEADYYRYTGEGAFKGSEVRNHSVWRAKALTADALAAFGLQVAEDSDQEYEAPESPPSAPQGTDCPLDGVVLQRGRRGLGHVVRDARGAPVEAHVLQPDGTIEVVAMEGRA